MLVSSVDSQANAESLARGLVEARLAACVQISAAITSIYCWKGCMESAEEHCLSIKTTPDTLDDAIAWLERNHPYDVPELIWWPIHANKPYADWAHTSVDRCST